MKTINADILVSMAGKARYDLEKGLVSDELLINIYRSYNPVEDTELFIARSKLLFPKLNCGIASVYLKNILGEGEIIQGSYGENNHTFLMIGNIVLDITADQFGGSQVYVGKLKNPWSLKSIA